MGPLINYGHLFYIHHAHHLIGFLGLLSVTPLENCIPNLQAGELLLEYSVNTLKCFRYSLQIQLKRKYF